MQKVHKKVDSVIYTYYSADIQENTVGYLLKYIWFRDNFTFLF